MERADGEVGERMRPNDSFRKAVAAGGVISDEMLEDLKAEDARGLAQSKDNLGMMEEEDYI